MQKIQFLEFMGGATSVSKLLNLHVFYQNKYGRIETEQELFSDVYYRLVSLVMCDYGSCSARVC